MYKSFFEDMKKAYQPMMELSTISKKTAESLIKEYSEYTRELMSSSLQQSKQLAGCKDMVAFVDAQAVYAKNLDSKLMENAQKQTSIMMSAKDETAKVMDELTDVYSGVMKSWMTQFKA
ncbi:phasin family protein [Pokkaliibacter sp. CJK22405]|uniref:phasin family protein n=1 Tax=Pokkaliibacter sp. CJK22405 TaxID=3384615 RepID=UPI003984CFA1